MDTDPRAKSLRTPGQRPEAATAGVFDANPTSCASAAILREFRP
jgi:hypothetical protein